MDAPIDRSYVAPARGRGERTGSPPARAPICAEVAAAALREALAGRRTARRDRHSAKSEPEEAAP